MGFRLDNLPRAATLVLCALVPIVVLAVVIGGAVGSYRFPTLDRWPSKFLWLLLWGTVQQYGLAAFYYRRLNEALPGRSLPMLAAATTFALFHLPNPFLTFLTLAFGVLSCWIYRRIPNLFALGLAHAIISFFVNRSLPVTITLRFRVGPQVLESWSFGPAAL